MKELIEKYRKSVSMINDVLSRTNDRDERNRLTERVEVFELIISDLQSLQPKGKTKEEATDKGFVELLKSLSINGGKIVCTNQLTPHDINDARDSGRMWVDEWGVGYAWMPTPFWPTTPEKVELFEKYYPNLIEVPEELSSENILNWIKNKEQEKKDNLQPYANQQPEAEKEKLEKIGFKECLGCGEIVKEQYACPECNPMG